MEIMTDSSAALGIGSRRGLGKGETCCAKRTLGPRQDHNT